MHIKSDNVVNTQSTDVSVSRRVGGNYFHPCNCRRKQAVGPCPARRRLASELDKLRRNKRCAARAKLLRKAPPNLFERLFVAFSGRCEYCGSRTLPRGVIGGTGRPPFGTIDRIWPGDRGGDYSPDNVTLACITCNSSKGARDFIGPVRSLEIMESRQSNPHYVGKPLATEGGEK